MALFPQTPLAHRRRLRAGALASAVIVVAVVLSNRGTGHKAPKALASTGPPAVGGVADSLTVIPPRSVAPAGLAAPTSYAPGVPVNTDPNNLYSNDGANMLSPAVAGDPARIYVPNSQSNTVSVIDPATYKVISTFPVGGQPQHVSPSYDLSVLWVENDQGNTLTPIDPRTGRAGSPVPVDDPYNLYFTPDGTRAIVMAEARKRLDFRDAHSMALQHALSVPCSGLNHMDFSPDGRTAVASCEFDGQMLLIDIVNEKIISTIHVGGAPQDVKLSPDGGVYYVADMIKNGVHVIDSASFKEIQFIHTGKGAHGLYPSRDAKLLYVSNRGEGSVSVISFATRTVVTTWVFDGGHGSPDMGGVSADGTVLWLTGRYDSEVYAISTTTGMLIVPPIRVGGGPHGACVWPQPGRYSMGHTGIFR